MNLKTELLVSNLSLNVLAMAVLASTFAFSASVAVAEHTEFAELSAVAAKNGHVAVVVDLVDLPPHAVHERGDGVAAEMRLRAQALVMELGPDALKESVWTNEAGQAGLQVTPAGLHKLRRSAHALRFAADTARGPRISGSDRHGA